MKTPNKFYKPTALKCSAFPPKRQKAVLKYALLFGHCCLTDYPSPDKSGFGWQVGEKGCRYIAL